MQMISGYIAGSTNLGNGVVLVHRIANLRQKLAAMGIERTIPTAMIDDQIISVADMIPRFDDCASLHRKNRRAVGIGNVQTIVVGGILAGNTDINRSRYQSTVASGNVGLCNKKCVLVCHNGSTVVAVSDYVSGY